VARGAVRPARTVQSYAHFDRIAQLAAAGKLAR